MQIVIEIPEESYNAINKHGIIGEREQYEDVIIGIQGGIALPEHHGRLIDADAFVKYCTDGLSFFLPMFTTKEYRNLAIDITKSIIKDIKEAPTIIEATEMEVKDADSD